MELKVKKYTIIFIFVLIIACFSGLSACANNDESNIKFKTLQVTGTEVYGEVSNSTSHFSFIDEISVADSATYEVCTDLACAETIPSKTVELSIGNNVFYILVKNKNDVKLFTVTIRRRPLCLVTTEIDSEVTRQYIEENKQISEPQQPNVDGYTFIGWEINGAAAVFPYTVIGNTTVKAKLVANQCTVLLDVNGGDPLFSSELVGNYNDYYSLETPIREGYTFCGWYDNEIKVDNYGKWNYLQSKTLKAKWNINSYNVTLNQNFANAGEIVPVSKSAEYNSQITISAIDNEYLGYTWLGWYDGETLLTTTLDFTFNVPAHNINYVAKWEVDKSLENYEFISNKTNCVITNVKSKDIITLSLPEYVTDIANYAFKDCFNLVDIVISNNVTRIGLGAFSGCNNLQSITVPFVGESLESVNKHFGYVFGAANHLDNKAKIPESLVGVQVTNADNIAEEAFYNCSTLKNINISSNTTTIGAGAFANCSGLIHFAMPANIDFIGSAAFSGCIELKYVEICNVGSWCNINFEDEYANPLHIAKTIYNEGKEITNLTIPQTVNAIGNYAFYGCENISNVTIPDTVKQIGDYAFANCLKLTSIKLPNGVEKIGHGILKGATKIASLNIPYIGSALNQSKHIGYFFGIENYASNLTLLPKSIRSIMVTQAVTLSDSAFYGCTSMTSISLPDSLTKIGVSAFILCENLQQVNISNIKSWCNIDFGNSSANPLYYAHKLYINGVLLNHLTIPNEIIEIKKYAFYGCNIESVSISDSVKTIKDYAFAKNDKLLSIEWGNSVSTIGYEAFHSCISLTSIILSNSVVEIGYGAFSSCEKLVNITLSNSVHTIDMHAFNSCEMLTSINIPNSVLNIGNSAFDNCKQLTIYCAFPSAQPGWDAFWNPLNRPVVWNYI